MPYLGAEPTAHHGLNVFKYVATSSQTTFTGADAGGATLSYDVGDGSCQVWLNGVRLDSADITATNGTSVVLAACTTGDIIHIQAVKALTVGDVVAASTGGTFSGAVVMTSPLAVASGGSGAATHTANGVLLGAGTGAMTTAAPSTSGNVLTSNGTVWASAAAAAGFGISVLAQAASTTNVTGNGTEYTIPLTSELKDTGSDFATPTFTAPSTGSYLICGAIGVAGWSGTPTNARNRIVTSNRTYDFNFGNWAGLAGDSVLVGHSFSMICDMDASDTAHLTVYVAGVGGDTLDISAGSTWLSIVKVG